MPFPRTSMALVKEVADSGLLIGVPNCGCDTSGCGSIRLRQRFEQHVVRMARRVAGAAVIREPGQVLLIWRDRHVTGSWGWEIPMGRVEEGESPDQAAAREAEEETGCRPGPARLLVAPQPSNGSVDSVHYLFRAEDARHAGPPSDRTAAERIEGIPLADVRGLIDQGAIVSGPTLIALLYLLTTREPPGRGPRLG